MDKIWLPRYPADVIPEIATDGYTSLLDMFEKTVSRYADNPAFINMGQVMTFVELEARSRAFAAYLQTALQLKKGDRVALMMPNLLQYPIALFGILRAGMVVVNTNPLYTERELEYQLKDSGAKAIVIVANFAHRLEKVVADTDVKHILVTHIGDQLSATKRRWVNFVVNYIKRLTPKYHLPNAISFRTSLRHGRDMQYVRPDMQPQDLAFLQYTGGTTGIAKGAMLSHYNLLANLAQIKGAYGSVLRGGQELIVTALPLYHIFALSVNCLLFIDLGGCNLLITNPRDVPGMVKELSKYPFTVMAGVNTLFSALVNNKDFCQMDFSRLRLAVSGGMPLQKSVSESWQALTGNYLLEGYGLTECSPLVAANPYNVTEYTGSIGLPVPSTDIRLLNNKGEQVACGETGELQVKGPQVMAGYWQSPEETSAVLQDGWLSTGDICTIDNDGFLHIVDRKKDMILVSGFNVYPNEIESVVVTNQKVEECAAIGIPSESSGEKVKICVVKKDPSLTQEELIIHCRKYLTGYKIPKCIEFYNTLPKSSVGKILRRKLREEMSRLNQ